MGPPANMGLSPHIRGNRSVNGIGIQMKGSIPAHTGKPYVSHPGPLMGLSPHIRGNRRRRYDALRVYPRTYGETTAGPRVVTSPGKPRLRAAGVYPRTYGETIVRYRSLRIRVRVYPRTYGESLPLLFAGRRGSIPAHTGKPGPSPVRPGLSPHIRGNRHRPSPPIGAGSIPAHTGKPLYSVTGKLRQIQGLSPHIRGNL